MDAKIKTQHSWPLRALRGIQFQVARLASRDGYVNARAVPFNLHFTGPGADCITRHIYRLGSHEPHITRYILDHVRFGPKDVGIDVGANIGWYSVLFDRLSEPGARVLAFEPDPESYRLLTRNLAANGTSRTTAFNFALGEQQGVGELHRYRAANNGAHTLVAGGNSSGGLVQVQVHNLREVWDNEQLGSRPIRFMKVDVEGFEYFVLRGIGNLLDACESILMEYNPASLRLQNLPAEALLDLLRPYSFTARVFTKSGLQPISYAELAKASSQCDLLLSRNP